MSCQIWRLCVSCVFFLLSAKYAGGCINRAGRGIYFQKLNDILWSILPARTDKGLCWVMPQLQLLMFMCAINLPVLPLYHTTPSDDFHLVTPLLSCSSSGATLQTALFNKRHRHSWKERYWQGDICRPWAMLAFIKSADSSRVWPCEALRRCYLIFLVWNSIGQWRPAARMERKFENIPALCMGKTFWNTMSTVILFTINLWYRDE